MARRSLALTEPRRTRRPRSCADGSSSPAAHFLYAFSSAMVHGVGRDAERVADAILSRSRAARARTRLAQSAGATGADVVPAAP